MQTSVSAAPSIGVAGDIADLQTAAGGGIDSVISEEVSAEIPFGTMVAKGTADNGVKLLGSMSDEFRGVAVRSHDFTVGVELGDTGAKPKCVFGAGFDGRFRVLVEDAVTKLSPVHVRTGSVGGTAGAFRGSTAGVGLVVADKTFTAEADDETLTASAHGLLTGDGPVRVSNSGGGLPGGLAAATDYWVIRLSANTLKLASSLALALAGTSVLLSTDGTGTQTLSDKAQTFTAEADDDTLTASAHGLTTGHGPVTVANGGGALPTGLAAATSYWVIRLTANTFKLATSFANAMAGTAIDITTDGTGTQTITGGTERIVSRDLSDFARFTRSAAAGEVATVELQLVNESLTTTT